MKNEDLIQTFIEMNKVIKLVWGRGSFIYLLCPVCSALVTYSDNFCGNCGQWLKESE